MEHLMQGLGVLTVILAGLDVFLTVLYPRSDVGLLTPYLNGGTWRLFRGLGRLLPAGGPRLMSFAGPVTVVLTIAMWVVLLMLGFAMLAWPSLGSSIQASHGSTPTSFAAALYYAGYTLSTLGFGDLVPKTGEQRILTVIIAVTGFSVLTLSLSYIISVYSALGDRNAYALDLHYSAAGSGDPAELLARLGAGGELGAAAQSQLSSFATGLTRTIATHNAYPVLHYFRAPETEYAMARIGLLTLDTVSLARAVLDRDSHGSFTKGSAMAALWGSGAQLFRMAGRDFVPRGAVAHEAKLDDARERQWRQSFTRARLHLAEAGLTLAPDSAAGADSYVAQRRQWDAQLRALADYMDYRWQDIAPRDPQEGEG